MAIKVSIDQWVVTTKGKSDLFTDNLNGCVAVCIESDKQIALTHVLSDALGGDRWAKYKHNMNLMLVVMRKVSPPERAVMVYSDDSITSLGRGIQAFLTENDIRDISLKTASGCRVTATRPFGRALNGGQKAIKMFVFGKANDNFEYSGPFVAVSKAGRGLLDNWGKLQSDAMDCE